MVTIDGSLLVGIAAILSSLGSLWRAFKLSSLGNADSQPINGACHCCQCRALISASGINTCGAPMRSTPGCQPAKPL